MQLKIGKRVSDEFPSWSEPSIVLQSTIELPANLIAKTNLPLKDSEGVVIISKSSLDYEHEYDFRKSPCGYYYFHSLDLRRNWHHSREVIAHCGLDPRVAFGIEQPPVHRFRRHTYFDSALFVHAHQLSLGPWGGTDRAILDEV